MYLNKQSHSLIQFLFKNNGLNCGNTRHSVSVPDMFLICS